MSVFQLDEKLPQLTKNHWIEMLVTLGWSLRVSRWCCNHVPYFQFFSCTIIVLMSFCYGLEAILCQNPNILINGTIYKQNIVYKINSRYKSYPPMESWKIPQRTISSTTRVTIIEEIKVNISPSLINPNRMLFTKVYRLWSTQCIWATYFHF